MTSSGRVDEITVTLHWHDHTGQERNTTVGIEDCTPGEIIPLLLPACELPLCDSDGSIISYTLHLDAINSEPLNSLALLSAQGVRNGKRVWLVQSEQRQRTGATARCVLRFFDGLEVLVPNQNQGLTRAWLLKAIELANPMRYAQENQNTQSPFRFVANTQPHCYVRRNERGYWVIVTERDDVQTFLNGKRVHSQAPERLNNGDRLQLGGEKGVPLTVLLI